MTRKLITMILCTMALLAVSALAYAQITPDDPLAAGSALVAAVGAGKWFLVAALAGVLAVWLLRKLAGYAGAVSWLKWAAWFATDRGGAILGFSSVFFPFLAGALASGQALTLKLLAAAVVAGLVPLGLFNFSNKVIAPSDLQKK